MKTGSVSWQQLAKPAPGCLVPLAVGYLGISPFMIDLIRAWPPRSGDSFRFAESITLGSGSARTAFRVSTPCYGRYRHQELPL